VNGADKLWWHCCQLVSFSHHADIMQITFHSSSVFKWGLWVCAWWNETVLQSLASYAFWGSFIFLLLALYMFLAQLHWKLVLMFESHMFMTVVLVQIGFEHQGCTVHVFL
jgi:hypothetical protein